MKEKSINGRKVNYLDVIHHTTTTHLNFWDRIKVLLGKEIIVQSEIYTQHEHCIVVGSEAKGFVPRLIPKKQKGGFEISLAPQAKSK